jgi:hypothetical protein
MIFPSIIILSLSISLPHIPIGFVCEVDIIYQNMATFQIQKMNFSFLCWFLFFFYFRPMFNSASPKDVARHSLGTTVLESNLYFMYKFLLHNHELKFVVLDCNCKCMIL